MSTDSEQTDFEFDTVDCKQHFGQVETYGTGKLESIHVSLHLVCGW